MSDLISRQVAIDSLTEIIMNLKNVYGDMGSAVNGARECIKSLPSADPEMKWIPCEERLPEDFQKVLVFWWEHSEPMIDTAFWQKDAKRFDGQHWVRMEDKVTHWMPLPKPPAFNEVEE